MHFIEEPCTNLIITSLIHDPIVSPNEPARVFSRSAEDDGLSDGYGAVNVDEGLEFFLDGVTGYVKGFDVLDALLLPHQAKDDRVGDDTLREGYNVWEEEKLMIHGTEAVVGKVDGRRIGRVEGKWQKVEGKWRRVEGSEERLKWVEQRGGFLTGRISGGKEHVNGGFLAK